MTTKELHEFAKKIVEDMIQIFNDPKSGAKIKDKDYFPTIAAHWAVTEVRALYPRNIWLNMDEDDQDVIKSIVSKEAERLATLYIQNLRS